MRKTRKHKFSKKNKNYSKRNKNYSKKNKNYSKKNKNYSKRKRVRKTRKHKGGELPERPPLTAQEEAKFADEMERDANTNAERDANTIKMDAAAKKMGFNTWPQYEDDLNFLELKKKFANAQRANAQRAKARRANARRANARRANARRERRRDEEASTVHYDDLIRTRV